MTEQQLDDMNNHFAEIVRKGELSEDPPLLIPCRDCGSTTLGGIWPCEFCGRIVCDACWASRQHAKTFDRNEGFLCGLLPGDLMSQAGSPPSTD